jgi:hypothetical protein
MLFCLSNAQGLITLIASNLVHDPIVRPFPTFRWTLACARVFALAHTDSGCRANPPCPTYPERAAGAANRPGSFAEPCS